MYSNGYRAEHERADPSSCSAHLINELKNSARIRLVYYMSDSISNSFRTAHKLTHEQRAGLLPLAIRSTEFSVLLSHFL